jgi:hypothetical protein
MGATEDAASRRPVRSDDSRLHSEESSKPLRVTLCPVNTAGVPWTNTQALRRRGIDARLVVFERYKLHPEADESLEIPSNSLLLSRQARQWAALAAIAAPGPTSSTSISG